MAATLLAVVMKVKSRRGAYNLSHSLKNAMIWNAILSTMEPPSMVEIMDFFFRKDLL